MLLAVDIGNTNTVFGFFRKKELLASFRTTTGHAQTADECGVLIKQFLDLEKFTKLDGITVATVVPRLEPVYRQMATDYYQLEPLFVDSSVKLNITFDYPTPAEVGADRICNAAAAYDRFGGPTIVVDFGTATTFDIISGGGAYVGGVIAPGIETALSTLAHRAAQLFKVSFEKPAQVIGKSTEEAMKSGFYLGAVGQTDHIIDSIAAEMPTKPRVIATGGLAPAIAPQSKHISEIRPDITLQGMRLIYELNR
ncbi:MAG: type III pantothenate kinase [candidate division Zixibacteria bacterium]|nr:type III pantothenate kinase [candidate division Zixibacteria bacterium]